MDSSSSVLLERLEKLRHAQAERQERLKQLISQHKLISSNSSSSTTTAPSATNTQNATVPDHLYSPVTTQTFSPPSHLSDHSVSDSDIHYHSSPEPTPQNSPPSHWKFKESISISPEPVTSPEIEVLSNEQNICEVQNRNDSDGSYHWHEDEEILPVNQSNSNQTSTSPSVSSVRSTFSHVNSHINEQHIFENDQIHDQSKPAITGKERSFIKFKTELPSVICLSSLLGNVSLRFNEVINELVDGCHNRQTVRSSLKNGHFNSKISEGQKRESKETVKRVKKVGNQPVSNQGDGVKRSNQKWKQQVVNNHSNQNQIDVIRKTIKGFRTRSSLRSHKGIMLTDEIKELQILVDQFKKEGNSESSDPFQQSIVKRLKALKNELFLFLSDPKILPKAEMRSKSLTPTNRTHKPQQFLRKNTKQRRIKLDSRKREEISHDLCNELIFVNSNSTIPRLTQTSKFWSLLSSSNDLSNGFDLDQFNIKDFV
ncbi:hypothetical protein P9112_011810 [Eukaryota sp. TZLM1-RC]